MDVISHGLWGGIAFGRKNPKNFLIAFLIGMAPDVFSFGVYMIARLLGFAGLSVSGGHMDQGLVPQYVHMLYNFTHSLFIFFIVFLIVWFFLKKPYWLLGAWLLHILVDIPTHSFNFFPTPFLWPISNFMVNGISWSSPIIFIPDFIALILVYFLFLHSLYKKKKNKIKK